MHILRLAALFAIVALGFVVWAQGARYYVTPRFGAAALVPEDWSARPDSDGGDARGFVSPDGAATETISGAERVSAAISDEFSRLCAPRAGEIISGVRRGRKWIAVSGQNE